MTKSETINLVNLLTIALGKMSDDEKQSANDLNKLFKRSGIFDIEKSSIPFNAGGYVQQVINILNTDLIAEENKAQAKANGDTKRLRAALDWQKRNKKMNTIREIVAYPDYQDDMQVYTDGHMVVVLKNYLGFEEKPESLCGEYGLSYKKAIPNTHEEEITMPDIAKLKVWYKNEKKNKGKKIRVSYNFGDWSDISVDAECLITAMEIMTPDTKWYASNHTMGVDIHGREYAFTHIYGENSIGEKCYLLGLKVMRENHTGKTEL